jgi:hypothetical protein
VADLLDPPAAGTERDDLAGPALVDHLFVQLADPPPGRPRLADHEDAVQPAVGDRAATRDGDHAGVAAALDDVGDAVPHEARLEFRELVARIGPGEHVQDALEDLAAERLVGRRAGHGREEVVDGPAVHHRHRDELLRKDVERVAGQRRRLDRARVHPLGDDGRFEQVAAVLREDHALRRRPDLVAGPSDPLQAAGDAGRRLHLDDEVDGAHVDAELQGTRGDQGREPAGLQLLLDRDPLLTGDAAVVGAHEVLAGQLVQTLGESLGEAAAVREDDRRAVLLDQLEDPGVDGRPDAGPGLGVRGRAAGLLVEREDLAGGGHVLDRNDDLQLERLAGAGVDDRHVAARSDAAEEPCDRLERALGGGQADALRRLGSFALPDQAVQPFQRQCEVGSPLRARDRVDLVDDHVLDAAEDVAGLARKHQVERLRGRDEDVRRAAGDVPSVLGGRVAGAARDADVRRRLAESGRGQGDACERGAEVALDVVGQGLERAHVEHPDGPGLRAWFSGKPIQGPEERGEGLATPRGGVDERVAALADRRPTLRLGLRRRLERRLEPGPDGGAERGEGICGGHGGSHGATSIGRSTHLDQMFYQAPTSPRCLPSIVFGSGGLQGFDSPEFDACEASNGGPGRHWAPSVRRSAGKQCLPGIAGRSCASQVSHRAELSA